MLAEPGIGNKVLLSQSVALVAARLGSEMRSGALLYFEQVNASGRRPQPPHPATRRLTMAIGQAHDGQHAQADRRRCSPSSAMSARRPAWQPACLRTKVPFVGAFSSAQALHRAVQPLRLQCARLYFGETEDRRAADHDRHQADRRLLQNDTYSKAGLAGVKRAMTSAA